MRIPIQVIELEAIDPLVAEVRLRTTPEGARFLARFMTGEGEEAKRADVEEARDRPDPP